MLRFLVLHIDNQSGHLLLSLSLLLILSRQFLVSQAIGLVELDAIFVVPWEFLHLLVEFVDLVTDIEGVNFLFSESFIELLVESLDERGHVHDVRIALVELVDLHAQFFDLVRFLSELFDHFLLVEVHILTRWFNQKLVLCLGLCHCLGLSCFGLELFEFSLLLS